MRALTKLASLVITTAGLTLAGCGAAQHRSDPPPAVCDAAAAQGLVGTTRPADADIVRLTRATIVRRIAPGDPVTHDRRSNRVTIETDPATDRVIAVTCG